MEIKYVNGDNVSSISSLQREMAFAEVNQVEAYWHGLCNGRSMPTRSEVDPRGISDALKYAFVLEQIAPGMARIRLAGMHLNNLMGMEVRGMPITALLLPAARNEIQGALKTVFGNPATASLSLTGSGGLGRPQLSALMFLAPLQVEPGQPARVLGAFKANGRIGRAPRRFELNSCKLTPIDEPVAHPIMSKTQPKLAFAEQPAAFQTAPMQPGLTTKAAHLRLITGGKDE